jgi:proline racemase
MKFSRFLTVIDAHTEGNPERILVGGIPSIPGKTMFDKAKYVRDHLDYLRTLLVFEPRGHDNMYASLLIPPADERADYGVIFLENGGYPTMCGHATISICSVLVEMGYVTVKEPETEIVLDTPAGLVHTRVTIQDGRAQSVTLKNVPSFLYKSDVIVNIQEFGNLSVDICYGGNFYAILPAEVVGLQIVPENAQKLIAAGAKIFQAVNEQVEVRHPENPQISGINFVEFSAPPTHPQATMKNVVIAPPLGMDRSPCGTGTCAKMAALFSKGKIGLHQKFIHESIIGTLFYGELLEETQVGDFQAVIPAVTGSAYIMGIQNLVVDPWDPFPAGFVLRTQGKLFGFDP